ncbi:MAG: hypothetical protein ACI9F9_002064, partial [Candidatus Paceibacteria bacterium]
MIPPMKTPSTQRRTACGSLGLRSSSLFAALALPLIVSLPLTGCGAGSDDGSTDGDTGQVQAEIATEWFDETQTKKRAEGPMMDGQRDGE